GVAGAGKTLRGNCLRKRAQRTHQDIFTLACFDVESASGSAQAMSVRTGSESDRITRSVIRNKNYRQLIRSLPLSVLLCLKSQCLIHTGLQPGVGAARG